MSKRILIVLSLVAFAATLVAQGFFIRGVVTDQSGAVIPGVHISAVSQATGAKLESVTDGAGAFSITALSAGEFEVIAELPGFKTWKTRIAIGQKQITEISVVLEVASAMQSVEVSTTTSLSLSASMSAVGTQRLRRTDIVDRRPRRMNTESYSHIDENPFTRVRDDPRSTFAMDVDTASYANVRRFLNQNELPPKDAVRIEELVNYFSYRYQQPSGKDPIAIQTEVTSPFWEPKHRLVKIGLRTKDVDLATRKRANLVFLIDVSGSMMDPMKLPLVKRSLHLLVDQLHDDDQIAMVVYAGTSGLVLPTTSGSDKNAIRGAIDRLEAGGSTNGGQGIQLAYKTAAENYIQGGINRVILATDGDFNVGVTNEGDLIRLIQEKASSGVSLTVLGFGVGNYKDSTLEKLADKGHGNYAYIDTFQEAKRVLVEQLSGTLLTVAKDVKLQIEFNPATVAAYRLIGYENRLLEHADFDNDAKQGGDVGAGLSVTALYEVVPVGVPMDVPGAAALKYQEPPKVRASRKDELLTVSIRYKPPEGARSTLIAVPVRDDSKVWNSASSDLQFAGAVAAFGMVLRESPHKGSATFDSVLEVTEKTLEVEASEYRTEFASLVRKARALKAGLSD
jgi:Ca-activated chloride channel family protein